jgi:Fe2+ transport system protein FeoA
MKQSQDTNLNTTQPKSTNLRATSADLRGLRVGQRAVVSAIQSCPKDLLRKLLSMGVVEGTEVCVTQRGFFGSPINIHLLGSVLSLRSSEAAHIQVQPL